MTTFADTSALYAVLDADDEFHARARKAWAALLLPAVRTIGATEEDHRTAIQALLAADRRDLSLVDCASFLVMRRLGLRSVFTLDADFRHQGFEVVSGDS